MERFYKRFVCGRIAAALALYGLIAALSSTLAQSPATAPPKPSGAASSAKGATMPGMAGGDMHQSMMQNMKKMEAMSMSGDTDRDFARMMKIHHQGAIDMAEMELKNGTDAKLRAMAKRIIADQQKEIKEFDQWMAGRDAKK